MWTCFLVQEKIHVDFECPERSPAEVVSALDQPPPQVPILTILHVSHGIHSILNSFIFFTLLSNFCQRCSLLYENSPLSSLVELLIVFNSTSFRTIFLWIEDQKDQKDQKLQKRSMIAESIELLTETEINTREAKISKNNRLAKCSLFKSNSSTLFFFTIKWVSVL